MTALLAVLLAVQAEATPTPAPPRGGPRQPVPLYTNEDLDRVHSHRHETGVSSEPAYTPAAPSRSRADTRGARGEEYWRREAARVREKVARLAAEAEELRAELVESEAKRREQPLGRGGAGSAGASAGLRTRARIAGLERRIRLLQEELSDRARRQGALPGWLR